jgi:hypothetical protein
VDGGNRGRSEPKKVGDVEFLGEKCCFCLLFFGSMFDVGLMSVLVLRGFI